jgi:hypothetical protein
MKRPCSHPSNFAAPLSSPTGALAEATQGQPLRHGTKKKKRRNGCKSQDNTQPVPTPLPMRRIFITTRRQSNANMYG